VEIAPVKLSPSRVKVPMFAMVASLRCEAAPCGLDAHRSEPLGGGLKPKADGNLAARGMALARGRLALKPPPKAPGCA